jgi:NADPH:quinone reductase-like Zn-dependent oxidoreductase
MKLLYKITAGVLLTLAIALASLALVLSHDSACPPAPVRPSGSELMQAIVYRCYGSPEVLALEEIERPIPADNQVLVEVQAASVNPLDWHYLRGSPYFMRLASGIGAPRDNRLGVDFSGRIVQVGKDVSRFKPGDEVFGGRTGAFGEYVVLGEDRALAIKPDNVTFEQAAAVPIAGVTALQALRDAGKIAPGMKVLINGASGGVGTFAVQIAKALGAEVTGVCSSRNVERVKSLGADHVIDYTRENYTEGGEKYELIIDNVGNHSPAANRRAMTPNGRLVLVGGPSGDWIGPLTTSLQALVLSPFVSQEFILFLAELRQNDLDLLAQMMAQGSLTPVIDRAYPLREVPAAIRYSEEGRARGKIIIRVQ